MADITITLTTAQYAKLQAAVGLENTKRGADFTAEDYLTERVNTLIGDHNDAIIKNSALAATAAILSVDDDAFKKTARSAMGDAVADILTDYAASLAGPSEPAPDEPA